MCAVDAGYGLVHADTIVATTNDVLRVEPAELALSVRVGDHETSGPIEALHLSTGVHEACLSLRKVDDGIVERAVRLVVVDPSCVRRTFGARYASLDYDSPVIIGPGLGDAEERTVAWDELWGQSELQDVVVDFEGPYKFVLWRGTGYVPSWTANNVMTTNFFAETVEPGVFRDCCEPMSDRECRYGRVRIVESGNERAVIHWRYPLCDAVYAICRDYWVDEMLTVYPDGVVERNCTLHLDPDDEQVWQTCPDTGRRIPCSMVTGAEGKRTFSNMEFITVNAPGSCSEDVTPPGAFTMLDCAGFEETYEWPNPPDYGKQPFPRLNEYIFRMNYRNRPGTFLACPGDAVHLLFQSNTGMRYVAAGKVENDRWETVEDLPGRFADFIHWPITRGHWTTALTDPALYKDRPTHTFLGFANNLPVKVKDDGSATWRWLCGIAPNDDEMLRALVRKRLNACRSRSVCHEGRVGGETGWH